MANEDQYSPIQDTAAIQETMEQLSGRSKEELFDALAAATREERAAGNLDNTRMDEIYEKLSPMLTQTQRQKMQQVLERLKE